ncbi:hypothetical protein C8R46DRAFT_1350890 [Mycena filopes]|nr:hypothetical protein C8R46DRAFT_1350890 [Mycena filopes]
MHPALRYDALNKLPPAMRRAAKIAYSPDSTTTDVSRLLAYLANTTEEESIWMLPVFYANLDPARVPDEDHYDTEAPPPDVVDAIQRAFQSLHAIYIIRFPNSIGVDLWPRAWPWIRFLYFYREHLPLSGRLRVPGPESEGKVCLDVLMFAGTFADHPESWKLVLATPGLRFLVARAWPHVLDAQDPKIRRVGFTDLRSFLAETSTANPSNLEELLDGAGSLDGLAQLVVGYINNLCPDDGKRAHLPAVDVFLLSILDLIKIMDPSLGNPKNGEGCTFNEFTVALLSHKIGAAITKILPTVIRSWGHVAAAAIRQGSLFLAVVFNSPPGSHHLGAECLENGLLRALLVCAQTPHAKPIRGIIEFFLRTALPPFLVRSNVLKALNGAMADIENDLSSDAFESRESYEMWDGFRTLLWQI